VSSFSQRNNYAQPPEISIREDLPTRLRRPLAEIAARAVGSKTLLQTVLRILDPYGLNPEPLAHSGSALWLLVGDLDLGTVLRRIEKCPWFQIYDIVEAVCRQVARQDQQSGVPVEGAPHAPAFEREINKFFLYAGIGWQLVNGHILTRGAEAFETTVRSAVMELGKDNRPTAAAQIHEALLALSRRPDPNLRGAITNSMGALECVARDLAGEQKLTLGEVLKRHPSLLPRPVDQALSKLWGYASDEARHVREGREPTREDAELMVGVAAAIATYLTCRHRAVAL
jgi:hypothetical protein